MLVARRSEGERELASELDLLLERALAKIPDERPDSAAAFGRDAYAALQ